MAARRATLFCGGDLAAAGHHLAWLAAFAAAMLPIPTLTFERGP